MERSWNPSAKDGFGLGNVNEKHKIEELKAEFKPLTKLMREVVGGRVEQTLRRLRRL